MDELCWGRKRPRDKKDLLINFKTLLLVGCFAFTVLMIVHGEYEEKYIQASASLDEPIENDDASAEPFGYFMGEWNLWEFIGDTVSSHFPSL